MKRSSNYNLAFAVALVAVLTMAACGGGSSTGAERNDSGSEDGAAVTGDATSRDGASPQDATNPENETASGAKAKFIKEADAICERIDEKQLDLLREAAKEDPSLAGDDQRGPKVAIEIGMPLIRQQAAEIGELSPPPGDEEEVQAILDAMTEAAAGVERQVPESLIGEFEEVDELSAAYGFRACAEAL